MSPNHGDAEIAQLIESLGQGQKVMLIQVDGAEIKKLTQTNLHVCAQTMRAWDAGGLLVLLSKPGDDHLRQQPSNLTPTYLQVTNHENVMLLQGVKPRTPSTQWPRTQSRATRPSA